MKITASKRRYNNEEHEVYIREHGDIPPDEDYEMDLKDSDRKKLWTSAGNRCSLCKTILVLEDGTIVGEECHISSAKPSHQSKKTNRHDKSLTKNERDSYDNAILLCANCHKKIDNPKNTQYTIEKLHQIKEKHEADVKTGVGESKYTKLDAGEVKERSERRKQLHEWIQEHNQKLIDNVIKPWYEHNIVSVKKEPLVIEHLRTGYLNLWELFEECKILKNHISEDKKKIKEHIKMKSKEGIPLYSDLEDIFESRIGEDNIGRITFVNEDEEDILKLLDDFATKGQIPDNYKGDFKEHTELIIKNKPLFKKCDAVNKNTKILREKNIEFEKGLEKIVHDFEEKYIPLKGACEICKEWHDELQDEKYDKERIYNWLYNETKRFGHSLLGEPNNPRWVSTIDIARHNHLPTDRVKEICIKHEGIVLMGKEDLWPRETLEEKWAIKEFVK